MFSNDRVKEKGFRIISFITTIVIAFSFAVPFVPANEAIFAEESRDIVLTDTDFAVINEFGDSYELYKAFSDKDSISRIILPSAFDEEALTLYFKDELKSVTISGEIYYAGDEPGDEPGDTPGDASESDASDTDADDNVIIDNENRFIKAPLVFDEMITFDLTDGSSKALIISQSSLPSISINLNVPLSTVHKNKEIKYEGTRVRIESAGSEESYVYAEDVTFKGRGNSSWKFFDKKGYQIKFSKKTEVLGMEKAKKWVLLADASDPTIMKNKLVFDTALQNGYEYNPESRYVDLWINGEYRGLYLICEKVEIGKGRVELSDEHAILVENDNPYYYKEEHYIQDSYGEFFVLKDYASETPEGDLEVFGNKLNLAEKYLNEKADWKLIKQVLDVDSFARSYLYEEYFQNNEATVTSYFMYMDGLEDKIHAGPLWDFDSTMNFSNWDVSDYYFRKDRFFAYLIEYPQFLKLLKEYYDNGLRESFKASPDRLFKYRTEIIDSVSFNTLRWNNLGTTSFKENEYLAPYDANLYYLESWLDTRNRLFSIDKLSVWQHITYVYEGKDYSLVFDPLYYADSYPDLKKKYGYDTAKLLRHFVLTGMNEKRNASPDFDIIKYINNYEDLRNEYGTDFTKYYIHFIDHGYRDGRTGKHDLIGYIVDEDIINHDNDPIDIDGDDDKDDKDDKDKVAKVTMFRLYNPNSGEHFYTASTKEKSDLITAGWKDEGIAWTAPSKSDKPVYRLYNKNAGDHHYTLSSAERDNLIAVGWSYEGIGWYSYSNKGKPILRVYNPNAIAGAHHFTLSSKEVEDLVKAGWKNEGIGWYAW